jgi:hypothetical protein
VAESFPSKCKALSSNPSTIKEKKKATKHLEWVETEHGGGPMEVLGSSMVLEEGQITSHLHVYE